MQILREDKCKIELINSIDIEPELKDIAEERNEYTWNKKSTFRKIASIPMSVFLAMGDRGFEIYCDNNKLKEFIRQHPEYRIDWGKI